MIPIPAIDLKGGKVVRLKHGDFNAETVYDKRPEEMAVLFEFEGARRLHVVDLDGALGGKPANRPAVEAILKSTRLPVEVGGGIRDLKTAESYFSLGVRWIIFGTKVCLDKGFLKEALRAFGERAIVGIDAKDGFVATDGWTKITSTKAADLVSQVEEAGGKTVIYTDISKDGALQGPNLDAVTRLCDTTTLEVIASGGVSSLEDLKKLTGLQKENLIGAIIGKALYEKKFTLKEAVRTCLPRG